MSVEQGYMAMICPECKSGLLYQHDELRHFNKCELCGFCEMKAHPTGITTKMIGHDDD